MISKTYLRYIWLLDTVKRSKYPLTFEDIAKRWEGSPYAYMGGLPIRTFHEHRKGIEEMFGVIIECDKSKIIIVKYKHFKQALLFKVGSFFNIYRKKPFLLCSLRFYC